MLDDVDGVSVVKVSDLIETEPWGFNADVKFLNCTAEVFVNEQVTPLSLLKECKRIEKSMGRDEVIDFDDEGKRIPLRQIVSEEEKESFPEVFKRNR